MGLERGQHRGDGAPVVRTSVQRAAVDAGSELALQHEVLAAVASGSTPCLCPTTPMACRARRGAASMSMTATLARPASGRVRVMSTRTVVDLPAPLPSSPKIVPGCTARLSPSSARTPGWIDLRQLVRLDRQLLL